MLEEQYAKNLLKLAKSAPFPGDIGPLEESWRTLIRQLESSALAHSESARRIGGEAQKVAEEANKARELRRGGEDIVRVLQSKLKIDHRRLQESKKAYESKCKEEITSNQAVYEEISRHGRSSKEAEKAEAKFSRSKDALKSCENVYKCCVVDVEKTRRKWERETETSLNLMQELEEKRVECARESLWRVANVISAACVAVDAAQENVREAIESPKFVENCIEDFAAGNRPAGKRPDPIGYEQKATSSSLGLGPAASGQELNRSCTSLMVPPKPPRLIHYASTASLTRKTKGGNFPSMTFPVVDSVDNIEYFNLSSPTTASPSVSSSESDNVNANPILSSSYEFKSGSSLSNRGELWANARSTAAFIQFPQSSYNERRIW